MGEIENKEQKIQLQQLPQKKPFVLTRKAMIYEAILIIIVFVVAGYFAYVRYILVANIVNKLDAHNKDFGCQTFTVDEILNVTYSYSLDPSHWANLSNQFNKTWKCNERIQNLNSTNGIIINGLGK